MWRRSPFCCLSFVRNRRGSSRVFRSLLGITRWACGISVRSMNIKGHFHRMTCHGTALVFQSRLSLPRNVSDETQTGVLGGEPAILIRDYTWVSSIIRASYPSLYPTELSNGSSIESKPYATRVGHNFEKKSSSSPRCSSCLVRRSTIFVLGDLAFPI